MLGFSWVMFLWRASFWGDLLVAVWSLVLQIASKNLARSGRCVFSLGSFFVLLGLAAF